MNADNIPTVIPISPNDMYVQFEEEITTQPLYIFTSTDSFANQSNTVNVDSDVMEISLNDPIDQVHNTYLYFS